MKRLSDVGECELIDTLATLLPGRPDVAQGIGDDCAVVHAGDSSKDWLLTSDAVIDGVHFESLVDPELIGRKAIARSLSDIAAMGGRPDWILTNLVAPPDRPVADIEAVYRGASRMAGAFDAVIIGGDTARGSTLELHCFAIGHAPRGTALLRANAKPDDVLFVTGALGGSLQGKHLSFEPRIHEGAWLRETGWVHAMIDLSDGLALDSARLARASGCGIELDAETVPVSREVVPTSQTSAFDHAVTDGEDYELLFTVPPAHADALAAEWKRNFDLPCTRIGILTSNCSLITCRNSDGKIVVMEPHAYEHFRDDSNPHS